MGNTILQGCSTFALQDAMYSLNHQPVCEVILTARMHWVWEVKGRSGSCLSFPIHWRNCFHLQLTLELMGLKFLVPKVRKLPPGITVIFQWNCSLTLNFNYFNSSHTTKLTGRKGVILLTRITGPNYQRTCNKSKWGCDWEEGFHCIGGKSMIQ